MPAGVGVRDATPDDAEAIARVHVETWKAAYRGLIPDEILDGLSVARRAEAWREWLTGGGRAGQGTWVAVRSDEVIGFANAGPSRDDDVDAGTGEVYAIYVRPAHWDTRVGATLMEQSLDHLRPHFTAATLWVLETNRRGRRFYEKGGWLPDGASQPLERFGGAIEVRYVIDLRPR